MPAKDFLTLLDDSFVLIVYRTVGRAFETDRDEGVVFIESELVQVMHAVSRNEQQYTVVARVIIGFAFRKLR